MCTVQVGNHQFALLNGGKTGLGGSQGESSPCLKDGGAPAPPRGYWRAAPAARGSRSRWASSQAAAAAASPAFLLLLLLLHVVGRAGPAGHTEAGRARGSGTRRDGRGGGSGLTWLRSARQHRAAPGARRSRSHVAPGSARPCGAAGRGSPHREPATLVPAARRPGCGWAQPRRGFSAGSSRPGQGWARRSPAFDIPLVTCAALTPTYSRDVPLPSRGSGAVRFTARVYTRNPVPASVQHLNRLLLLQKGMKGSGPQGQNISKGRRIPPTPPSLILWCAINCSGYKCNQVHVWFPKRSPLLLHPLHKHSSVRLGRERPARWAGLGERELILMGTG